MKKLISSSLAIVMALLLITSCSQENETVAPDDGEATISVAALLEASLKQVIQSDGKVSAERTITGTLTATNLNGGAITDYDWYAVIDEDAFTVESSKTIVMEPGQYDFSLVLADGNHIYAGAALDEAISEGENVVSLTLKPVFGDVNIDFTVWESANLKFSYPVEDFSVLTDPYIGLSIDGGDEMIYSVNPNSGFSESWINVEFGEHTFVVSLYDGEMLVGRSNPDHEAVNVSPNQNILIDLLPLFAEVMLDLNLEGGEVTFNFTLPPAVADEVGGVGNLRTVFRLNSTVNGDQEVLLNFTDGEGEITASHTFTGFRYDIVNLSMVFMDDDSGDEIGYSTESGVVLSSDDQDLTMHIDLRRRAVITGNIMAVVGVNVFDLGNAAVGGAEVYVDDDLVGITGSGAFGTAGYLRVFLPQGTYTITAIDAESGFYGEEVISVLPLDVTNVDIILDQQQQGVGLSVRDEVYGYNGQNISFNELTTFINSAFESNVDVFSNYEDINNLLGYKALYVNAPTYTDAGLTENEINNLQEFAAQGGKIWILGENTLWTSWNNSIARLVGGTYDDLGTGGTLNRVNIVPGLNENAVSLYTSASSRLLGGTVLYGSGEITLWGDKILTQLDVNIVDDYTINSSDNRIYMRDAVNWLNN